MSNNNYNNSNKNNYKYAINKLYKDIANIENIYDYIYNKHRYSMGKLFKNITDIVDLLNTSNKNNDNEYNYVVDKLYKDISDIEEIDNSIYNKHKYYLNTLYKDVTDLNDIEDIDDSNDKVDINVSVNVNENTNNDTNNDTDNDTNNETKIICISKNDNNNLKENRNIKKWWDKDNFTSNTISTITSGVIIIILSNTSSALYNLGQEADNTNLSLNKLTDKLNTLEHSFSSFDSRLKQLELDRCHNSKPNDPYAQRNC